MEYTRKNKGTCAKFTKVVLEDGIVKDIEVTGGCDGNIKGVIALSKDRKAQDVIDKLKGTKCSMRGILSRTSCPDQIAKTLEEAIKSN